jgi:hypothetical protein
MRVTAVASADTAKRTGCEFDVYSVAAIVESIATDSGRRFVDLVQESPVLLVFLRHAGCTFCREALADISRLRQKIEAGGARIVLVHMADRAAILDLIIRHGLLDVERICDEDQVLYKAFGLSQGNIFQLFGLKVWWRGFAAVLHGHGLGLPGADVRQMPGVFYINQGLIARHFRHRTAADRPLYDFICIP